ncbi:MAG: 50S ribosomal protein L29 [Flavobacterium sp.]|nr:50S ribosomal protein L29 [Flavobacterium sp.]
MNIKDLRKKTPGELDKELSEKAVALSNFRFGTSGSKTKNVKAGKNLKKEIAQILTILHEVKIESKNLK